MRIIIRSDKTKFRIRLPLILLRSKILINAICKKIDISDYGITTKDLSHIIGKSLKELRAYKGLEIVNIKTANDDIIRIII